MARTHQQVFGTSTLANELTHNGRHSTIDEVEKHARRLYYIEQNVDMMWATMERVEAMMSHMA